MDSRIKESSVVQTLSARMGTGGNNTPLLCIASGQANAETLYGISPSLSCNHEQPIIINNNYSVRRLTPMECERLQGFPDAWTESGINPEKYRASLIRGMGRTGLPEEVLVKKISDSKRYKALGNSVAIPCVEYVLQGIIDVLQKENTAIEECV
jgi:site-specific DNA-cytosine methylase